MRNVATHGLGIAWSPDSQAIYYSESGIAYKVPASGGQAMRVRQGPTRNVIGFHGATMYFMVDRTLTDGSPGFEIHAATPEDGPSRVLGPFRRAARRSGRSFIRRSRRMEPRWRCRSPTA